MQKRRRENSEEPEPRLGVGDKLKGKATQLALGDVKGEEEEASEKEEKKKKKVKRKKRKQDPQAQLLAQAVQAWAAREAEDKEKKQQKESDGGSKKVRALVKLLTIEKLRKEKRNRRRREDAKGRGLVMEEETARALQTATDRGGVAHTGRSRSPAQQSCWLRCRNGPARSRGRCWRCWWTMPRRPWISHLWSRRRRTNRWPVGSRSPHISTCLSGLTTARRAGIWRRWTT